MNEFVRNLAERVRSGNLASTKFVRWGERKDMDGRCLRGRNPKVHPQRPHGRRPEEMRRVNSLRQTDRQKNGFAYTTRHVYYAMPRRLGPSHPDTNARCAVMMTIRPYKPRDSARSALLTAVRSQRSGLAVHPPRAHTALRPLTGAVKYAWGALAR